jgi:hypothetical protein
MEGRQQLTMEDVVGAKVLLQLHPQAYEMLALQGIDSEKFIARVAGVDGFGLWIENPNYCTVPVFDDNGEYIPPENRAEVCYRAVILIQWSFLQTVIQFPERASFRAGVDEQEIGFKRHTSPVIGMTELPDAPSAVRKVIKSGDSAAVKKSKEKARG